MGKIINEGDGSSDPNELERKVKQLEERGARRPRGLKAMKGRGR